MPCILAKVYQMTSYTEFNKLFELTELNVQHHMFQNLPVLMLHPLTNLSPSVTLYAVWWMQIMSI
jgi:hypothetical protein